MYKEDEVTEVLEPDYCQENSYKGIDPIIVRIVKNAALRAIGKAGYREHDRADIEQELMTAAIIGLRDSDCDEAQPVPINLVKCIVERQLCGLMRRRLTPGKDWHRRCISLNEEVGFDEGETIELLEFVDTHHKLLFGIPPQRGASMSDFAMDLETFYAHLTAGQRRVCELLRKYPRRIVAKKLKVPRYCVDAYVEKLTVIFREWRNFR